MSATTAALLSLGALTALNLLLVLRLGTAVRDLRRSFLGDPTVDGAVAPGTRLPELTATTLDGRSLDRPGLADGRLLVAFLSTTCVACRSVAPELAGWASSRHPGGRVLAVVVSDGDAAARTAVLDGLGADAAVVADPDGTARLREAFGVDGYPTVVLYEDGVVVASGHSLGELDAGRDAGLGAVPAGAAS